MSSRARLERPSGIGALLGVFLSISSVACGGSNENVAAPPASSASPDPSASAAPSAPDVAPALSGTASASPAASIDPNGDPASAPAANNAFAAHLDDAKVAKEIGGDNGKLLQIAKLSPKTQKSLLKNFLYAPLAECQNQTLVDVLAAPGVLVASKGLKLQAKAFDGLKAAGLLAKQRGMSLQVTAAHVTIKDAVKQWNRALIDAALGLVKQAPPADQKDKSFAGEARKQIDDGEGPKSWTVSPCDSGRLGGWAVDVELVALDAGGKPSSTLVKAGDAGEHFTKDAFESIYWDKPKGKSFRTLTEIMSAGKFVRQCDKAYHFTTSPTQDETWRCKLDTESWDPSNRPLPAWQ